MVKKGGLKRKIPIEKKTCRGPCYSKRCQGLFGKASQLCLLSGAQIAVLATPISDNSNVSFFSFGHSSVDAVVSAFLSGKRPLMSPENSTTKREDIGICLTQKNLGLGFWWEDEAFTRSQNPQELSDAVDSMSKLLKDVKQLRSKDAVYDQQLDLDVKNNDMNDHLDSHHGTQEPDQTLTTPDAFLQNTDSQIMPNSEDFCTIDNNNENALPVEYLDQTLTNPDDFFENMDAEIMAYSQDFCITDNNNSTLPAENLDDIDMDLDQIIDFGTTSESLLSSYDGVLKTSFESLLFDGVFESTLDLQEFAASLLTCSDSHDSMDPIMFSGSQPVKHGDLVLQNRGLNG